jgi:hypothetical protein
MSGAAWRASATRSAALLGIQRVLATRGAPAAARDAGLHTPGATRPGRMDDARRALELVRTPLLMMRMLERGVNCLPNTEQTVSLKGKRDQLGLG